LICFAHPVKDRLNSTPQLLARDSDAVSQGAVLGPGGEEKRDQESFPDEEVLDAIV
jgi:hypothetical protein